VGADDNAVAGVRRNDVLINRHSFFAPRNDSLQIRRSHGNSCDGSARSEVGEGNCDRGGARIRERAYGDLVGLPGRIAEVIPIGFEPFKQGELFGG